MSYILEALKKAESDRLSGAAPVIGAPVERFLAPEAPRRKRWRWLASPLTAAAIGTFMWFTMTRTEQETTQPASLIAQIDPPAGMPSPSAAPRPAPHVATPAAAVPQAPVSPPAAVKKPATLERASPPKPVEKRAAPARNESGPASVPKAAPAVPAPAPQTIVAEREPVLPQQPAPVQESLPFLHELPAQVQREIPKFTIGGYLYSGNKAGRSLLVNRRLLHEGDQIAPGLVIEEMRPQEMILNYRGTRYRSNY
jgi:general secretion pathway protein B